MITLFTLLKYTCMSFANRGQLKMGNQLFKANKVKWRMILYTKKKLTYSKFVHHMYSKREGNMRLCIKLQ
jgi:hypothetical protein